MSSAPFLIYSLICHDHVEMGADCLRSLLLNCLDKHTLTLYDDGSLTEEDKLQLRSVLQPMTIVSRDEADDVVLPQLINYPNCRRYRREHPLAIKLIDMPLMSHEGYGYCDTDIRFVQPFTGFDMRERRDVDYVYMLDEQDGYSIRFIDRYLTRARIRLPDRVNTGMTYLRGGVYDLDFVEWFLTQIPYRHNAFTVEQTCWAAIAARVRASAWSPIQVAVPRFEADRTSETIALHYISPVRHLLQCSAGSTEYAGDAGGAPRDLVTCDPTYRRFATALAERVWKKLVYGV